MTETTPFCADIEWLGWQRPALKSVAEKLLALPAETMRRATVVVPTSGSGRRLKEYMAEISGHGLLMPKIILVTQLLSAAPQETATWCETRAAWVKVLTELMEDEWQEIGEWADLFPQKPQGGVSSWAHHAAEMLCHFRKTLEQECVDDAYIQLVRSRKVQAENRSEKKLAAYFDRLDTRWELIHELFKRVDSLIVKRTGKRTQEQSRAAMVANPPLLKGALIFACVPEVSPQTRLYLQHYAEKGGKVAIWVNAPEAEAGLFDAFGQPVTEGWLTRPISFPRPDESPADFDESCCLHLVHDAKAMGRKAVELAAAAETADVALISCDTAMDAALTDAFEHPQQGAPWKLFLPAGRSAKSSPVSLWLTQLQKAVQMMQNRPVSSEGQAPAGCVTPNSGFEPLLRNRFLQQLYVVKRQAAWEKAAAWDAEKRTECENFLLGFNGYLDRINQIFFPDTAEALLNILQDAGRLRKQQLAPCRYIAIDYARDIKSLAERAAHDAKVWQHAATYLRMFATAPQRVLTYVGDFDMVKPLQKEAEELANSVSEVTAVGESFGCSAAETFDLLLQTVQKNAKALSASLKSETHADLNGWKEAAFTKEEQMIICGMHGHCLPEPVSGDMMLPNTLRLPIGMTCAESREARDAFLYTALLNSRKAGHLHVVVAQQQDDGTPISPSTLLLHCGEDLHLLARRAAYFFGDAPVEESVLADTEPWRLHQAADNPAGGMESIALLGKSAADNPYADERKKFSPSSINDFLSCPLRFWMKTLFRMNAGETYQTDKLDMDAKEYGTVMHDVLRLFTETYPDKEAVGKALGRSSLCEDDAAAMVAFLQQQAGEMLREAFAGRFGEHMSLAVEAQQRMQAAALHIFAYQYAHELLQGWVSLFHELALNFTLALQDGSPAEFAMTIDRVDYLPEQGRWRIIDYKSHPTPPDAKYYATAEQGDTFDRLLGKYFPLLQEAKSCYRWKDIQLPLYALGLQRLLESGQAANEESQRSVEKARQRCPQAWQLQETPPLPELCYINIPKSKVAVSLNTLHTKQRGAKTPLTAEYLEQAVTWVKSACYLMRRGLCLYSAESLKLGAAYGDFSALTPEGDPRALFGLEAITLEH